jgi:AraC-like DNA-binding protein/quercetin dioxygenase-like cupin family protein
MSEPVGRTHQRQPVQPERAALTGVGYLLNKTSHIHNRVFRDYALVYVLDGGGIWEDELGHRENVKRGDVLMVIPGVRHSYYPNAQQVWSEYYLVFNGAPFQALESEGTISRHQPVLHPGYDARLVTLFDDLIDTYIKASARDAQRLAMSIFPLIAEILRRHDDRLAGEDGNMIAAACSILSEQLDEDMDLHQVALRVGTTYDRLRRTFQRQIGMPLTRDRMDRRIERAQALLLQGNDLAAVAERLGYCDQFFFARQFKQVVGMTPGAWRRNH